MSTNTFDREIKITDLESLERLINLMSDDVPGVPLSSHPNISEELRRGENLVKQCIARSKHLW